MSTSDGPAFDATRPPIETAIPEHAASPPSIWSPSLCVELEGSTMAAEAPSTRAKATSMVLGPAYEDPEALRRADRILRAQVQRLE